MPLIPGERMLSQMISTILFLAVAPLTRRILERGTLMNSHRCSMAASVALPSIGFSRTNISKLSWDLRTTLASLEDG